MATQPKCSFGKCGRPARAAGLCVGHYSQHVRGSDLAPLLGARGSKDQSHLSLRVPSATKAALARKAAAAHVSLYAYLSVKLIELAES